jgi:hypothetical protein
MKLCISTACKEIVIIDYLIASAGMYVLNNKEHGLGYKVTFHLALRNNDKF